MYKTATKHKLTREQKTKIINDLKNELLNAKCIVLANYQGLNSENFSKLRRDLRNLSLKFNVVKNKFLQLAIKGTKLVDLEKYINNPIGIIILKDEKNIVNLFKYLINFTKETPQLKLCCAYLYDTIADVKKIEEISKLPSKEELIAKLLGVLSLPIRRLYITLNSPIVNLLNILKVKSEKK